MHKLKNANIAKLTTMRIGGDADYIYYPETVSELIPLIEYLREADIPWAVLGAGSNTLAASQGMKGAVICMTSMNHYEQISSDSLLVGAGLRMPKFAGIAARLALSGGEFYEGIPGSIGGAIVMNAGAHGGWTAEIISSVTVYDIERGELIELRPADIDFGYRHSNIDNTKQIIVAATYRLGTGQTTEQIQDTMREHSQYRNQSQPKGYSSGCIFRNPAPDLYAGRLIDELGLKGVRIGGAEISLAHGNFIVNDEGAKSQDICALIHHIQLTVWEAHAVWLKPEVQPLGDHEPAYAMIWTPISERPSDWIHTARKISQLAMN